MIALFETDTGRLVSLGSTAVVPTPNGMTALDLGSDDRLLTGYGYWDAQTRTVKDIIPSPVDVAAELESLRQKIITQAIAWLEEDSAAAQQRATSVSNAVTTAQTRRAQAAAFTFNGSNVSNINNQLNNSLRPLLVDILDYIIGLGQLAEGMEQWRGTKADPSLVWLARASTDTVDL